MSNSSYSVEYYQATDITASAFVFASAGAGKTKILVDRFIKLLLFGSKPGDILAVTFTNVAAYEMETRIISILKKLALNEDGYTRSYLENEMGINNPNEALLEKASTLFYQFIDSSYNITTIHSFGQSILYKYPFEAYIYPKFEIIDEMERNEILDIVKRNFFNKLTEDDKFVKSLSRILSYSSFEDILENFLASSSRVNRFFKKNKDIEKYETKLKKLFNVFGEENSEYSKLENIYLTKNGEKRKKIDNNKIQALVYENRALRNKNKSIQKTCSFLMIAKEIYENYQDLKSKQNFLDFTDIIYITQFLLLNCDVVLSEIGSNIKHILIDEVQDMNSDQWNIVSLISNEVFSNHSDSTLFVVGDTKQSIYGFQDANPELFVDFYNIYKNSLPKVGKRFTTVNLKICYRLCPAVQKMVDNIFIKRFDNYIEHYSYRKDKLGISKCVNLETPEDIAQFVKDLKKNPNDIMILTKNRTAFSNNVAKRLVELGVPVAASDRINLNDSLIILDIIAVAEFVVNNNNDYALTCILKSPYIFDIPLNEEEIFQICYKRKGSIFESLKENTKYNKYVNYLENIKNISNTTPFDFFYRLAYSLQGYMEVSCFLELALNRVRKKTESIYDFLVWFKNHEIKISVDQKKKSGVNISTIHSSKGLEYPVIILLDFSMIPELRKTKFIWTETMTDMNFFIKSNKNELFFELENIIENYNSKEKQEILNLLYVAMTRARDELYIVGPLVKANGAYDLCNEEVSC